MRAKDRKGVESTLWVITTLCQCFVTQVLAVAWPWRVAVVSVPSLAALLRGWAWRWEGNSLTHRMLVIIARPQAYTSRRCRDRHRHRHWHRHWWRYPTLLLLCPCWRW